MARELNGAQRKLKDAEFRNAYFFIVTHIKFVLSKSLPERVKNFLFSPMLMYVVNLHPQELSERGFLEINLAKRTGIYF